MQQHIARQRSNVVLKEEIDKLRVAEVAANPSVDYKKLVDDTVVAARGAGQNIFEAVGNLLKTTVIPEKADYLANKAILQALKTKDFSGLPAAPNRMAEIIELLIAAETYRVFETTQGSSDARKRGLAWNDPSLFDYQNTNQSAESEAVLLALVSAIQSIFNNPDATPADLIRLFNYDINNRRLTRPELRAAAKAMIADGSLAVIITQGLIDRVKAMRGQMNIHAVQKLANDAVAMRQKLVYMQVPEFNFVTGRFVTRFEFMRWVGSEGDGACGHYTLRFPGRNQYNSRIVDNVGEASVISLAHSFAGMGAGIYGDLTPTSKLDCIEALKNTLRALLVLDPAGGYQANLDSLLPEVPDSADYLSLPSKDLVVAELTEAVRVVGVARARVLTHVAPKKALEQKIAAQQEKTNAQMKEIESKPLDTPADELSVLLTIQEVDTKELASSKAQLDILKVQFGALKPRYDALGRAENKLGEILTSFGRLDAGNLDVVREAIAGIEAVQAESAIALEDLRKEKGVASVQDLDGADRSKLRLGFAPKEKPFYDRIAELLVSPEELKRVTEEGIRAIDDGGWLNMGANAAWSDQALTYPFLVSLLGNYEIYVWVDEGKLPLSAAIVTDGVRKLVNYVSAKQKVPGSRPYQIHMYNTDGQGHYSKFVRAGDGAGMANAFRHKRKYEPSYYVEDTIPDKAAPSKGSVAIDWPF